MSEYKPKLIYKPLTKSEDTNDLVEELYKAKTVMRNGVRYYKEGPNAGKKVGTVRSKQAVKDKMNARANREPKIKEGMKVHKPTPVSVPSEFYGAKLVKNKEFTNDGVTYNSISYEIPRSKASNQLELLEESNDLDTIERNIKKVLPENTQIQQIGIGVRAKNSIIVIDITTKKN